MVSKPSGSSRSWQQTAAMFIVQSTTALCIFTRVPDDDKVFQALRYENGGELCVVTGPITKSRQFDSERMYHVASDLILPYSGCPLIGPLKW